MPSTDVPADPAEPTGRPPRGLRRLDRRAIAICVCIAAVVALAAGLVASFVVTDEKSQPSSDISLAPSRRVDDAAVLTTRLLDFDDKPTSLAAYAGRGTPVVLNFFSSTCAPCIREMPAFESVHRSDAGVRFVGVDVQDEIGPGRALVARTGITYAALRDPPGDLLRSMGATALPTTVLIDGKGHIVNRHTGALTEGELRRLIDTKLR